MEHLPTLYTERLIINSPHPEDIPQIIQYAGNPNISATTLNIPHPYTEKDALTWIDLIRQGFESREQFTFAIRIRAQEAFIGAVGLKINQRFNRAALGYWLAEDFWNKGYITEAVARLMTFGFEELQLNKIYATHLVENPASGKVMQKNGMIKEGVLKEHARKGDRYVDLIQYRLTSNEYLNQQTSPKV